MAFSKIAAENLGGSTLPALSGTNLTSLTAGKILQVQYANIDSDQSTSGTSYAATSLTDQITPSATSSKILISINGGRGSFGTGATEGNTRLHYQIGGAGFNSLINMHINQVNELGGYGKPSASFCHVDSPNTTSAVDYTIYFKTNANTYYWNSANSNMGITLMEIGA